MKKKLSVLVIGSLLAISMVGCSNGTNTDTSTPSSADSVQTSESSESQLSDNLSAESGTSAPAQNSTESAVESTAESSAESKTESTAQNSTPENSTSQNGSTSQNSSAENSESTAVSTPEVSVVGPEEGDIIVTEDGQEIVYHEESGIVIDEESMQVTSDGKEELPKYLPVTYNALDVNGKNISANSINFSNPAYYTIKSTAELSKFVSDYDKTYSLNTVDSGITFSELTKDFDDNYFEYTALIVIPAKYAKDTEPEIGEITVSDSNYNIQVCTAKPENDNNTDYTCFVIQANKSELGNSKIVLEVVEDGFAVADDGDV